jgi:hypothetical protein
VTFYAWLSFYPFPFLSFPFLSFHFIFLLTSTGQTGKPMSVVEGSNDAFPPKEVPFWVSLNKFELAGSVAPKSRQKVGVVYGSQPNSENQ